MKNTTAKVNLLIFSLEKKLKKLEEIRQHTLTQAKALADKDRLSAQILEQKQESIEEIKKLDQGFAEAAKEWLPLLQADSAQHADGIRRLQDLIGQIAEAEEAIQQLEKQNYANRMLGYVKKEAKEVRSIPKAEGIKKYRQAKKRLNKD